jgi:gliding motility-associated-like protein
MKKLTILSWLVSLVFIPSMAFAQNPINGLVASFPFTGNANDESGNGFNGIIYGATLTTDRCNKDSSAYLFDGYNDYIKLPIWNALNTDNSFSIVAWFNNYTLTSDGKYSDNAIFGQTDGESASDYPIIAIVVRADNTLIGLIRGTYYPSAGIQTQAPIQNNTWYQVALVRDAQKDSLTFFLNGILIGKVKTDLVGNTATNDWASFGAYYDDLQSIFHFFCGKIDDILVYDRALSDEEIKKLYTPDCLEFSIHGEINVCQGEENIDYYLTPNNTITDYEWTYTGTGVNISDNSDTISVNFSDSATSGRLVLVAISNGGDSIISEISISVNNLPEAAGSISGEAEVCISQTGVKYAIPIIPYATSYDWHYTGDGVILSGSSDQISMDLSANVTNGQLTVSGINSCGIGTPSPSFDILINSPPSSPGSINGLNEVCNNTGEVPFSVPEIDNATAYIWNYSGTGVTIQGDSATVNLYFFTDATSGNLSVYGMNKCGQGISSDPLPIIVKSCAENPETLSIPNSFSPNGDGINDYFIIRGLLSNSKLVIFDRFGKECYESDDYQNNWDGKDKNGKIMESDTYWYVCKISGIENEFKGFVYLKK